MGSREAGAEAVLDALCVHAQPTRDLLRARGASVSFEREIAVVPSALTRLPRKNTVIAPPGQVRWRLLLSSPEI